MHLITLSEDASLELHDQNILLLTGLYRDPYASENSGSSAEPFSRLRSYNAASIAMRSSTQMSVIDLSSNSSTSLFFFSHLILVTAAVPSPL